MHLHLNTKQIMCTSLHVTICPLIPCHIGWSHTPKPLVSFGHRRSLAHQGMNRAVNSAVNSPVNSAVNSAVNKAVNGAVNSAVNSEKQVDELGVN